MIKVNRISYESEEKNKAKPKKKIRNILLEKKYVENLFVLYNNSNILLNDSKKQKSSRNISKENFVEDITTSSIKTSVNEKLATEIRDKPRISIIPIKTFNETISPLKKLLNQTKINSLPEVYALLTEESPLLDRITKKKDLEHNGYLIQNFYVNL